MRIRCVRFLSECIANSVAILQFKYSQTVPTFGVAWPNVNHLTHHTQNDRIHWVAGQHTSMIDSVRELGGFGRIERVEIQLVTRSEAPVVVFGFDHV